MDRVARWQALYEEAGRPGARAFRTFARKKGEDITSSEALELVKKQASGQVFQGRLPSDGKVTASRAGMRWQVDLLDFSKRASSQRGGASKYALTVIDVYSKEAWVETMLDKTDQAAKKAMRKIVQANGSAPKEVSCDLGREFSGVFTTYLEDQGVAVRRKDPQAVNSIAAVDRMQQEIKKILKSIQGADGWAKHIKRAVSLYNDRENSALYGAAPDDVEESKTLQYQLELEGGEKVKHNNDKWRKKVGKIQDAGAFRTPLDRSTWGRIDQPKFSGKVHEVSLIKGANVEDKEGNSFPVRQVLAVPKDSEDVELNDDLIPGSGKRKEQLKFLKPFADSLKQRLSEQPTGEMSFAGATRFLKSLDQFEDTAELYRLPSAGRFIKFMRLFGFEIRGSGPGMVVRRPAGSSAASSGRPAGSVDIAPRMPRRGLPAGTAITWQPDNPYRAVSAARARYQLYRGSSTVGEARSLGATPQDFKTGLQKGYAQL